MAKSVSVKIKGKQNVSKAASEAGNALQQMTSKIESMTSGLKASWLAVGAAVAGIGVAIKKTFDVAQYGAQTKQISMAFESMAKQAGKNADIVLAKLKKTSGGTISELNLMQSAARASLLGLPLDKLDELMQIARASATATGESVQKMFDDIVTGIGRGSPMILDNLGITIKIGEATDKYAQSIGKTAEELTAAERKQAILNATLESGKKIMEQVGQAASQVTAAERWQRLQASFDNLKRRLGEALLPLYERITEGLNKIVGTAIKIFENLPEVASLTFTTVKKIISKAFEWDTFKEIIIALGEGIILTLANSFGTIINIVRNVLNIISAPFRNFGEWLISVFKYAWGSIKNWGIRILNSFFEWVNKALNFVIKPINKIAEFFGKKDLIKINFMPKLKEEILEAPKAFKDAWNQTIEDIGNGIKGIIDSYLQGVSRQLEILKKTGSDIAGNFSDEIEELKEKLEKLFESKKLPSPTDSTGKEQSTLISGVSPFVPAGMNRQLERGPEQATTVIDSLIESLKELYELTAGPVIDSFRQMYEGAINLGSNIAENIQSFIKDPLGSIGEVANNLVQGFTNLIGGFGSFLGSIFQGIMAFKSVQMVLQPLQIIIGAALKILEPVVNKVLAPLIGIFVVLGEVVGKMLAPVIESLSPVIEALARAFVWFYNKVIMPVGNFIIEIGNRLYNAIATVVNGIINGLNSVLGWAGVNIKTRMATRDLNHGKLKEITYQSMVQSGEDYMYGQGITAGITPSQAPGSETTVQRVPDIYIYQTFEGPIIGAEGMEEFGRFTADSLEKYAGIGGRIHIEEAIAPVHS